MQSIKLMIVSLLFGVVASQGAIAHSMTPGYEKIFAPGTAKSIRYTVKNDYDYPATFRVEVYDKYGEELEVDWKVDKEKFKLFSDASQRVNVKIRMKEDLKERKVLVCSVLDKVGYNDEEPATISRVCSRLWLWR